MFLVNKNYTLPASYSKESNPIETKQVYVSYKMRKDQLDSKLYELPKQHTHPKLNTQIMVLI